MILLAGIRSEPPLQMVIEALNADGIPHIVAHQRDVDRMECAFSIDRGRVEGRIVIDGQFYPLDRITGAYLRLMDDRDLPEIAGEPENSPRRLASRQFHDVLIRWAEIAPVRIINRMAPMASNASKPFQAQLIRRAGFAVPATLVTSDPDAAAAFCRDHGRVIFKSVSGVRSIVREVGKEDLARLDRVRWCPTQFQAYVDGMDVRVHVVGENVIATAIETTGTDYRYAGRDDGGETRLSPLELPEPLAQRCVELARTMGLAFAGIDLRLDPEHPDAAPVCFEVNPCPAYSYYEGQTGQPIARTVARYLAETYCSEDRTGGDGRGAVS